MPRRRGFESVSDPDSTSQVRRLPTETAEVLEEVGDIIRPRLLACVAGLYPGGREHALDLVAARDVIAITRTQACIVHIARPTEQAAVRSPSVADLLSAFTSPAKVVPLINTSRARNSHEALRMIQQGLTFLQRANIFAREPLIKLEIMDSELNSITDEVLRCVVALPPDLRCRCIPYVAADQGSVERVCDLGCPAVRIAAGRIGQRSGIVAPQVIRAAIACARRMPVILEGGLDSAADIEMCASLGAEAALVNSAFPLSRDPRIKALELRQAADRAWRVSPARPRQEEQRVSQS